jgi:hypothetical protein
MHCGVANAAFAASPDLGNFSGNKVGDKDEASTKSLWGAKSGRAAQIWENRAGFTFFYGPGEAQLAQVGAKVNLAPPAGTAGGHNP